MSFDLILKNGIIVTSDKTIKTDIGVKDGQIASIEDIPENAKTEVVFDAEGLFILPGVIDAHVHFREPGLTHKEDFKTGSRAAAAGGITFFADMPNTLPPTSTVALFNEKLQLARTSSCIDFGLFALLNNNNTSQIQGLVKAGALGFKVFLGTSTGDIASPCDEVLTEQIRLCTQLGKRTGFHAETSDINAHCTNECKQKSATPNGVLLCGARPVESEIKAVKKALDLAKKTNAMIHIHHVTSKPAVELIAKAKNEGVSVTAETCPHYLFFNAENSCHKVYPPIRFEEDRLALWEAVKNGVIDMIATDHAPHTAEEKSLPLWDAPAGLTGAETFINLLLNEVNRGTITLNDFVRLTSENPAKIWGLEQKGKLQTGADADFTIVDMNKKVKIDAARFVSKSKISPYDGMELQGAAVAAVTRGRLI